MMTDEYDDTFNQLSMVIYMHKGLRNTMSGNQSIIDQFN